MDGNKKKRPKRSLSFVLQASCPLFHLCFSKHSLPNEHKHSATPYPAPFLSTLASLRAWTHTCKSVCADLLLRKWWIIPARRWASRSSGALFIPVHKGPIHPSAFHTHEPPSSSSYRKSHAFPTLTEVDSHSIENSLHSTDTRMPKRSIPSSKVYQIKMQEEAAFLSSDSL